MGRSLSIPCPLAALTFLLLAAAAPDRSAAQTCDPSLVHAAPSVQDWPAVLTSTLDFGVCPLGSFEDQVAPAWNAGYGDWVPGMHLVLWAVHNVSVAGNVCLDGHVHANGSVTGGSHFTCGGTYDSGYVLMPPAVYTEPDSFPGATYYYVTVRSGTQDTLLILDRTRTPLRSYVAPATPHPSIAWTFARSTKRLTFVVKPTDAFDQTTGPFPRLGADSTVVVNFGGSAGSAHLLTDLQLQETGSFVIESTIINTRFTGISTADRVNHTMWVGGTVTCKTRAIFAPRNCIPLICQTLSGNAQVYLGTSSHPAFTYVMDSANFSVGVWSVTGSLACLWDVALAGGVNLFFSHFRENQLPAGLRPCSRLLDVYDATFTGPDAALFSLRYGFSPRLIGVEPLPYWIHFDDSLACSGVVHRADLVLSSRDDPRTPGGTTLRDLTWHLTAEVVGAAGIPETADRHVRPPILRCQPNPFSIRTNISFELATPGPATLTVLDVRGHLIARLLDGDLTAGVHQISWDGRDQTGRTTPAGSYFIQLNSGATSSSRKLAKLN